MFDSLIKTNGFCGAVTDISAGTKAPPAVFIMNPYSAPVLLFSKLNRLLLVHFDPEIVCLDNKIK